MTRDQMIDSVIDILDETINEFETLSKSVSESSGGGEKLTAGGLSGVTAVKTKMENAGSEIQPLAETESGLESSTVSEKPEGLDTRGYKESGVNAKAFQKADEEEEKEEEKEEEDKKKKKPFEKKEEKEEDDEVEKADDHEEEETEEEEKVEEKAKKKMKKAEEVEKKEEKEEEKEEKVEKSVKENESLMKSLTEMQEQIKSLSQAVKDLSEMPVPAKGIMFNGMKPLKKSEESEVLSKSEIVNKLFELQKSGKDISTEEIVKAELGSDESANAIAKKYL